MHVPNVVLGEKQALREQEGVALAVAAALDDALDEHLDQVRTWHLAGIGVGAGGVLLGLLLLGNGSGGAGIGLLTLGLLAGGGIVWYAQGLEPDVEVKGVQKRYWSAHLFSQGGSTIVYDATDGVDRSEFVLEELQNPGVLDEARRELSAIDDLPILMPRDANVEGRIRRTLENVDAEVANSTTTEVDAPIVDQNDAVVGSLRELAPYAQSGTGGSDGVEIPVEAAREDVRVIERLEELAFEDDSEDDLDELKRDSEASVESLAETRAGAVELLNDHIQAASDVVALSTYNFYCPHCAADDVESQLDLELDGGAVWHCSACQGRFQEELVLPRHQIRDEIVTDVWDQLWIEKDDERRRTYERIEDQKAELKEREFEQKQEEIRTTADRVRDIQSKIRDLKAQANAGKGAIQGISRKMVEYRHLSEKRRKQFVQDVREERQAVRERTEEIIEETSQMREKRIEEAEAEAERRAELREAEKERRHRERLAMQEEQLARQDAQLAKQQEAIDQREQHHDERMLLDTEGEIHSMSSVNWWREKKGDAFGKSRVGVSD